MQMNEEKKATEVFKQAEQYIDEVPPSLGAVVCYNYALHEFNSCHILTAVFFGEKAKRLCKVPYGVLII